MFFFSYKKKSNIISKLSDDFSEDFFEVLHISVGENCLDFLTFSEKNTLSFLKLSNFELQKSYMYIS